VAEILVGYARCSTTSQDVRAQLSALKQLGVSDEHLHTDRGRRHAATADWKRCAFSNADYPTSSSPPFKQTSRTT